MTDDHSSAVLIGSWPSSRRVLQSHTRDSFRIEDQLVDGEKVVTRMTGEPVTLLGINIARIVDGKLVEEWNTWEQTKATAKLNPSVLSA